MIRPQEKTSHRNPFARVKCSRLARPPSQSQIKFLQIKINLRVRDSDALPFTFCFDLLTVRKVRAVIRSAPNGLIQAWRGWVVNDEIFRCSGQQPGTPYFCSVFYLLILLLLLNLLCPLTKTPFPSSYELETSHIFIRRGNRLSYVMMTHPFVSYEHSKFIISKNRNF